MSEQQVKTVAKRTRRAVVLSNGADKTVVVEVLGFSSPKVQQVC